MDLLDVFVRVGQSVSRGEEVVRSYRPAQDNQESIVLHIFSTEEDGDREVRLITEGTVQQCGTLELSRLPPANQDRQIQAKKLQKFHYIVCCVRFRIHHRTFLIM